MSNEQQVRKATYRMRDLPGRTGMGASFLYSEIKAGNFPQGKLVAPNIRVWTEEIVEAEMQRRFDLYNEKSA